MSKGYVSAEITEAAREAIDAAIATIHMHLSFLIALSAEQRTELFKLGPRSLQFVQQVAGVVKANPDLVPKAMDPDEFLSDVALVEMLGPIYTKLAALAGAVDDTRMAAGSDAITSAVEMYAVLGRAKRTVPGLEETVRELGVRFRKKGRNGTPEPTEAAIEPPTA